MRQKLKIRKQSAENIKKWAGRFSLSSVICVFLLTTLVLASGCATTGSVQVGDSTLREERQIATLTGIDITDNTLNINADKPFKYTIYKPADPYKAIVELPDMRLGIAASKIKSDKAGITEIVPSQTEEPLLTKLEILLSSPASIVPAYKDTLLTLNIINLEEELKAKTTEKAAETPKAEEIKIAAMKEEITAPKADAQKEFPLVEPSLRPATSIVKVDIEKEQDVLKLIIKGNGSLSPNVFELDNRIVLDMPNVTLEAPLPKAQSPLKGIRTGKYKDKIRIVLDMKEKTSFTVTSIEDSVIVSFQLPEKERYAAKAEKPAAAETKTETAMPEKPLPKANEEAMHKRQQKISLDFQDADIRPIFRLLADVSGYNFVIDPAVTGKITMKLMNVPWEQALDIILRTFSLGKLIEGNVIRIAPIAVFAKESEDARKAERERQLALEELSPLERKTYHLKYANVVDVQRQLLGTRVITEEDQITKVVRTRIEYDEKLRVLSPRGTATADEAANVLVVSDIPTKIAQVDDLIKVIDIPKRQVLIEAKIVTVSKAYTQALGIRWGGTIGDIGIGEIKGGAFSVNTPIVTAGAATPNPGGVLGLNIGSARTVQVDLSLSALETIEKAQSLASPRVLTLNNQKATIKHGQEITIPPMAADARPEKVEAVLSLNVTPTITPDDNVYLKVEVTNDTLASVTPPLVNRQSIDTQALVKSGETLVLGGIYTTTTVEDETGVPLLSKIPILGWLFKTKEYKGPDVSELLIFITPRIVTKS